MIGMKTALWTILGLLLLSGCQAPAPDPSISVPPAPEPSLGVEELDIAPESSEPPLPSAGEIPEELIVELLDISPTCPACGEATMEVRSLDYEAPDFEYKRPCGHGGYPNFNDVATVAAGQCTLECSSCKHTQVLDVNEGIMYCPYENGYSEDKSYQQNG